MGNEKEFLKLKTLLFERKTTYKEIAEEIGVGISAFNKKINGDSAWTYPELLLLKKHLNLSNQQFLNIFFED